MKRSIQDVCEDQNKSCARTFLNVASYFHECSRHRDIIRQPSETPQSHCICLKNSSSNKFCTFFCVCSSNISDMDINATYRVREMVKNTVFVFELCVWSSYKSLKLDLRRTFLTQYLYFLPYVVREQELSTSYWKAVLLRHLLFLSPSVSQYTSFLFKQPLLHSFICNTLIIYFFLHNTTSFLLLFLPLPPLSALYMYSRVKGLSAACLTCDKDCGETNIVAQCSRAHTVLL